MRTCDTVRFVFDAIVTRCGVQANIVVFVLGNGMKCRFWARRDGHYRRAFIRRPTYLERSELTLATTTIMRLTESHAEAVLHRPVDWNDSARLVSRPESWRDRSKISPVDGRTSAWTKGFPPFPSSTIWSIAKTALQLSCF